MNPVPRCIPHRPGPLGLAVALALWVAQAQAATFQIQPLLLGNGVSVSGTISTDGTVGPLSSANITGWNLRLRQTTRNTFTPAQGGAWVQGVTVSADGRHLSVRTSPDGVRDGGLLAFGSFGPYAEQGVQVANFTGSYAASGMSFYVMGATFEWQWRDAPLHSRLRVARSAQGNGVFQLLPVTFPSGTVMSGTLSTNGRTGALTAQDVLDWTIRTVTHDDTLYTRDAQSSNSALFPASTGLSSDGTQLLVDSAGGYLAIGVPAAWPRRPAGVVLADFSTSPRGQVGWLNAFTVQYKPLHFSGTQYPIGQLVP